MSASSSKPKDGEAPNIIPDYTEALFYVRNSDEDHLGSLREMFENIVHGAALQAGFGAELGSFRKVLSR